MTSLATKVKRTPNSPFRKVRRRGSVHNRRRGLALEALEGRLLLTVASDLVGQLQPYQSASTRR